MLLQIGILTPQGGLEAHKKAIEEASEAAVPVDTAGQLAALDGLVLAGDDAVNLLHLLRAASLFDDLREFGRRKPILAIGAATCLLAREVKSPVQDSLGLMNIGVECSGQIDHLTEMLRHEFDDDGGALKAVFVHPPVIRWAGPEIRVLARHDGNPVLVDEGLHMASTFHPELVLDRRIQAYFMDKVRESYWSLRLRK
jgi:pyridoxal 5'-phosphate synthase pdxT subunit